MKNKIAAIACAATMVLGITGYMPQNAFLGQAVIPANADTYSDFWYEIHGNEVTITGYNGHDEDIYIPESIDGYKVTEIGDEAFCTKGISSVYIPSGVRRIGKAAFAHCYGLQKVELSSGIKSIDDDAFYSCESLTYISIPQSIERIGEDAFLNCYELSNVSVSENIKYIGEGAFTNTKWLEEHKKNEDIVVMGRILIGCFCSSPIIIPDNVDTIGYMRFSGSEVFIPSSVKTICTNSFGSVSNIVVDENNPNFSSIRGVLYNKDQTELIYCPGHKENVIIPDSVTSIHEEAFKYSSIINVYRGINIAQIGNNAFYGCWNLSNIDCLKNLVSVGDFAFVECPNLKSIIISKNVTNIGKRAFGYNYYEDDHGYIEDEVKIKNFKLYCYTETMGEQYAIDNNFEYELIDDNFISNVHSKSEESSSIPDDSSFQIDDIINKDEGIVCLKIKPQNEEIKVYEETKFDVLVKSNVHIDYIQFALTVEGGYIDVGGHEFELDLEGIKKLGFDIYAFTEKLSPEEKSLFPNAEEYQFMGGDFDFDNVVPNEWVKIGILTVTPTSNNLIISTSDKGKNLGATGFAQYDYGDCEAKWITIPANVKVISSDSSDEHENLSKPKNPTISYKKRNGAVDLKWSAVDGADKYAVCGYVSGKWTCIAQGSGTSYTLKGLQTGKKYKVAVMTRVNGVWNKDPSNAIEVSPKKIVYPVVTTKVQGRQFRLSWPPVDRAEEYGIAFYSAGKWKVYEYIPGNINTYTSKKMPSGTYKAVLCAKVNGEWELGNINSRAIKIVIK